MVGLIHQVLSRIQHDPEFVTGEFELGYVDRFDAAIHRVGLGAVAFPKGERRVFEMTDDRGRRRRIPFHRVREVYRDGQLIWQRQRV